MLRRRFSEPLFHFSETQRFSLQSTSNNCHETPSMQRCRVHYNIPKRYRFQCKQFLFLCLSNKQCKQANKQANNASKQCKQVMQAMMQAMRAMHASNASNASSATSASSASKQTTSSMWACTAAKKQSSFMREKSDL